MCAHTCKNTRTHTRTHTHPSTPFFLFKKPKAPVLAAHWEPNRNHIYAHTRPPPSPLRRAPPNPGPFPQRQMLTGCSLPATTGRTLSPPS